jgi:hypothetical protein
LLGCDGTNGMLGCLEAAHVWLTCICRLSILGFSSVEQRFLFICLFVY